MTYETIQVETDNGLATVTLNRPEVHNCLSDQMVLELTEAINSLPADTTRLVTIQAKGHSFCAGADLNDMKRMIDFTKEENREESSHLSNLMKAVKECPIPTMALVQGPVYGGGCGLVACCDVAIATPNATFCFSEVRLGLIPAVISPYVYAKIGESQVRHYFITAATIDAHEAKRIGLVHRVVQQDELHAEAKQVTHKILGNGPKALQAVKELIRTVNHGWANPETREFAINAIADIRVSKEGQEGLTAFFEKRTPSWKPHHD